MVIKLLMAVVCGAGSGPVAEKNGVRVVSNLKASIYTWEVFNVDAPPITDWEIAHHNCYNFTAPPGWDIEETEDAFRAWTTKPGQAIRRRGKGTFSMRVTSRGAALGLLDATVGFDSGESVALPGLWGPVPKPRSTIVLVATTVAVIIVLHTAIVFVRLRRARERAA